MAQGARPGAARHGPDEVVLDVVGAVEGAVTYGIGILLGKGVG